MEKLEIDDRVQNGQLIIDLPADFNNKMVHVIVSKISAGETKEDIRKWSEIPKEERLQLLNKYKGSAKYPDFPVDKYDVYEQ